MRAQHVHDDANVGFDLGVARFTRFTSRTTDRAIDGCAARQVIAGRMLLAGLDVFQPIGEDTPVDLLVLRPDGVALKCQCKAMFVIDSGVHVMPFYSIRKWGPNAKAVQHRYTRDEVDFFLGYAVEVDTVFVLPFDATAHFKSLMTVWLLREPAGNNGKSRFDVAPYRNAFHLLDGQGR